MIKDEQLALAKSLVSALEQGDEAGADELLDKIAGVRESQLFQEVGQLTRQLHDAMANFSVDSKLTEMTEKDMPDAKERLNYVITMTEQAADQTLTVVENLLPVSSEMTDHVNALASKWERFLGKEMPYEEFKAMSQEITEHFKSSMGSLEKVESGLNEILMAQAFQDITGQIIRKVITLVSELETSMVELIRISGGKRTENIEEKEDFLQGPVVPGVDDKTGDVAASQDDVDDLLSSLGF